MKIIIFFLLVIPFASEGQFTKYHSLAIDDGLFWHKTKTKPFRWKTMVHYRNGSASFDRYALVEQRIVHHHKDKFLGEKDSYEPTGRIFFPDGTRYPRNIEMYLRPDLEDKIYPHTE